MGFVEEMDLKISKENLPYFVKEILRYEVKPHHSAWMRTLVDYHRTCTISARGHGKSQLVSVGYPLWVMCCNPQINVNDKPDVRSGLINNDILIFSNKEDQGNDLITRIRMESEENETLQSLTWAKGNMSYIGLKEKGNRNKIKAAGVGTSVRGQHPRIVIVDDPLAENNISNEDAHNFFFNVMTPMMLADGYIHVVGTRFACNDLYNTLSEPAKGYKYAEYPALDKDNTPLWPERYSYEALMQFKAAMGSLGFAREYLCNPIDSSSSVFPMDLTEPCRDPDSTFEAWGDGTSQYLCSYDLALGAKADSDYFVATTLKKVYNSVGVPKIKIANIFYENQMDYTEQIEVMHKNQKRYNPVFHYVENNGYQVMMEQMMANEWLPVKGRTTNRQNKETSIFKTRTMFEHKTLELPYGDFTTRAAIDRLLIELSSFGYKNNALMGLGKHDDMVMSLAIGIEGMTDFKSVDIGYGVTEEVLPLGINGNMNGGVLDLPWVSTELSNLGVNNYSVW